MKRVKVTKRETFQILPDQKTRCSHDRWDRDHVEESDKYIALFCIDCGKEVKAKL